METRLDREIHLFLLFQFKIKGSLGLAIHDGDIDNTEAITFAYSKMTHYRSKILYDNTKCEV